VSHALCALLALVSGASAAVIERVELDALGREAVHIALSAAVTPVVRHLPARGDTPERVVVDLPQSTLASKRSQVLAGRGAVARVRVGQFAVHTARVVIELARSARHAIRTEGTTVVVELVSTAGTSDAVPAPPREARVPQPSPAASGSAPDDQATALSPFIALEGGARLLWPNLDDPAFAEPFARPLRDLLARWRAEGGVPPAVPPVPGSPAAALLAADLQLLRAVDGADEPLAVLAAYESAGRMLDRHPEAPRAALMQGVVAEWLGMGPEASAAYARMLERFPEHALTPWARLGLAAALRLRRRPREAHAALDAVLATARGALRCAALRERGRIARAETDWTRAAGIFRDLARQCPDLMAEPGMLHELAETLAASGARAEARQLLVTPRLPRSREEESRLDLLLGDLAYEAGDNEGARAAWDRVLGRKVPPRLRLQADRRLAKLEADPRRQVERLLTLATEPLPADTRAELLVDAAEIRAASGATDEALALLEQAARLGPAGAARADARRAALLGETIRRLYAAQDWSGLVTLYAARTTAIRSLVGHAERRAIAEALTRLGLQSAAMELIAPLGMATAPPEARLTAAEQALAAGDVTLARTALAGLERTAIDTTLAGRAVCARARLALAEGDPVVSANALGVCPESGALAGELARSWYARGEAAAQAGALDEAAQAWERALAIAPEGAPRRAAALGLARLALARGDAVAAARALDEAAREASPLIRRAVAALVTASSLAVTTPASEGTHAQ